MTAGTVFQDTRTPLTVWFRAMWLLISQKNGVSAVALQRVLGWGSYQTAWTCLHKLRRAMAGWAVSGWLEWWKSTRAIWAAVSRAWTVAISLARRLL